MEQKILEAETRTVAKKGAARRLRAVGKIPAIVYGHSGNSPIYVDAHDFHMKFRTVSENTIINLKLGDSAYDVLVKDYQEDILTGSIVHIDFFEIEAGKALRTNIPIRLVGTPAGVREGGVLEHLLYMLEVECLPKDIPEEFVVNVDGLSIGDSVHVSELDVPSEVRALTSEDQVVVAITTMKIEIEEEEEVEEGLEGEEALEGEEGEEAEGEEGEEAGSSEEAEE